MRNNALMRFFKSSYNYINAYEDEGKKKLRTLIGKDIIKRRGEYWYWGISELKKLEVSELEKIILKIERSTPPFVSDDFQIGYNGAYEHK